MNILFLDSNLETTVMCSVSSCLLEYRCDVCESAVHYWPLVDARWRVPGNTANVVIHSEILLKRTLKPLILVLNYAY